MANLWRIQILLWELLYLLSKISHTSAESNSGSENTKFKHDLILFYEKLNETHYDKRIPPHIGMGKPTTLQMDIFVQSVGEINEMQMAHCDALCKVNIFFPKKIRSSAVDMVTVNIFLRMRWIDQRLKLGHTTQIVTDYELADLIWLPDPYFVNGDGERRASITNPNRFFRVSPEGGVFYSQRLTVPFACPMNLTYFPLDKQTCTLALESYGHTTEDLTFEETEGGGVNKSDDIQIAQFKLVKLESGISVRNLSTGVFARMEVTFRFDRLIGHYIFTVYISSVLIICLSWVSFWLDVHAVPARISLGVLCVLTQTTQTMSILGTTPRVSYFKAIDIWMASCMFFTFCALVEFAIANSMARYVEEVRKRKETESEEEPKPKTISNGSLAVSETSLVDPQCHTCSVRRRFVDPQLNEFRTLGKGKKRNPPLPRAHIMDRISRVLFPVMFLCLNIGYWITFKALPHGTIQFNS